MKKLIDWTLDEPTVTKHLKGHRVSNLTVIFNARVYGTVTFALRNQLCRNRNGEVDEKRGHIYIIKVLLKGKNEISVDIPEG